MPGVAERLHRLYMGDIERHPRPRPRQEGPDSRRTSAASRRRTTRRSSSTSTKPTASCSSARCRCRGRAGAQGVRARSSTPRARRPTASTRSRPGPYMVKNNASWQADRVQPGKQITLVRNPNWDPQARTSAPPTWTDRHPGGLHRHTSATRRSSPAPTWSTATSRRRRRSLKLAAQQYPDQLVLSPRAVIATSPSTRKSRRSTTSTSARPSSPRRIVRRCDTRGGLLVGGRRPTIIPPGIPGFEQAGGLRGPEPRLRAAPHGDPGRGRVHEEGRLPSGKSTGNSTISMVGDNSPPGSDTRRSCKDAMKSSASRSNWAGRPRHDVHEVLRRRERTERLPERRVGQGLHRRAGDARPAVQRRRRSRPTNNSNWPLLDVPAVNKAIERGEVHHRPAAAGRDVRQGR